MDSARISWLDKGVWAGGDVESASHFHPAGSHKASFDTALDGQMGGTAQLDPNPNRHGTIRP